MDYQALMLKPRNRVLTIFLAVAGQALLSPEVFAANLTARVGGGQKAGALPIMPPAIVQLGNTLSLRLYEKFPGNSMAAFSAAPQVQALVRGKGGVPSIQLPQEKSPASRTAGEIEDMTTEVDAAIQAAGDISQGDGSSARDMGDTIQEIISREPVIKSAGIEPDAAVESGPDIIGVSPYNNGYNISLMVRGTDGIQEREIVSVYGVPGAESYYRLALNHSAKASLYVLGENETLARNRSSGSAEYRVVKGASQDPKSRTARIIGVSPLSRGGRVWLLVLGRDGNLYEREVVSAYGVPGDENSFRLTLAHPTQKPIYVLGPEEQAKNKLKAKSSGNADYLIVKGKGQPRASQTARILGVSPFSRSGRTWLLVLGQDGNLYERELVSAYGVPGDKNSFRLALNHPTDFPIYVLGPKDKLERNSGGGDAKYRVVKGASQDPKSRTARIIGVSPLSRGGRVWLLVLGRDGNLYEREVVSAYGMPGDKNSFRLALNHPTDAPIYVPGPKDEFKRNLGGGNAEYRIVTGEETRE